MSYASELHRGVPYGLDEAEPLSTLEEQEAALTGDYDRLVTSNLRLLWKESGRVFGIDRNDAYGIGCEAALDAARKWDPTRGARFSTYVTTVAQRAMWAAATDVTDEGEPVTDMPGDMDTFTAPTDDDDEPDWAWQVVALWFDLAALTGWEKTVLGMYHGIIGPAKSFRQIAEALTRQGDSTSHTKARRIYVTAITKVRAAAAALYDEESEQ